MVEQHFGESRPFSLGIEEEIMILEPASLMPAPRVRALVEGAEQMDLPGRLKTELHASVVELNTSICASVSEAAASLRALRRAAASLADENDLRIAAAGSHPRAG